ncbi:putative peptidoglycan lipid II flippase [Anaerosolibacter carboniphilus]|uniref:Probable lipid II flippase MurJ n=1 Tax=Anaerosolibacter carboniphilus TaxID=1417629 RepID=A0A841KVW9_9FIRM|nr:murein biosynthesis integral membrane protein MurJ [Anaerosolibacter carboniphilus]MBB6216378.1 putative peptidoglycan lipid II flippase [Anaerosolibacter carboniphilus]
MKKTAIIVMLITIISKGFGFFRDLVLSYFYGATQISDIYLISTIIPSVIFAFVVNGIVTSYIPVCNSVMEHYGEESTDNFTNNLINFVLIISFFIIIGVYIFAQPIVKIFAIGFEGEVLDLATLFTRISVFGILFNGAIYILGGYLQLKNNFIASVISGIPLNLVIILSIICSSYYKNVLFLPVGMVIATLTQMLFLYWLVKNKNFKYRVVLKLNDRHLRQIIILSLPVILGISVNQINILIDRTIASNITTGGISALSYANRLNMFVHGIFVVSISTVIYPVISKLSSSNNTEGLKKVLAESVNITSILLIPTIVGSMIFSTEIIELLFARGAFSKHAVNITSSALFFYSIGMIGFGLREVLSRFFYSMHDTTTPMINASIGMFINIFLNFILSKYLGIGGLALATSIAATLTTLLLFISLRKKIGPFGMKQISISFLKILFASLLMGFFSKMSFNYLTTSLSQNLSLLIAIGVGAVSYFGIIYFMKIEDVDAIVGAIKKKLGRGAA